MPKSWTPPPPATIAQCHAAFESALVRPTYGERNDRWPAYVNADLLAAFAEDDALGRDDLVPRHDARMAERFPRKWPRPTPDRRAWESAGNALHWGVRLGLLTEEAGPDGERTWRLVRREATFALDKKWRVEQVAGLAPEAQAARDKKAATNAKLTRTLARKECVKAGPGLASRLRVILEHDPAFVVPQAWSAQGFVPEWTVGRALSACLDDVRDAPLAQEFSKAQLAAWRNVLNTEGVRARHRAYESRKAAEAAAREADLAAAMTAGAPPDEDLAALDAL